MKGKGFHFSHEWSIDQGQSHIVYPLMTTILNVNETMIFEWIR